MDRKFIYIEDSCPILTKPPLGFIACDIETSGLDWARDQFEGFSFSLDGKVGYYTKNRDVAKKILSSEYKKVFHNATFDLTFLRKAGFVINGEVHCSLLLAHIIDADRSNGLKDLSSELFGESATVSAKAMHDWLKETYGTSKKDSRKYMTTAPIGILTAYAAEDALNTYDLFVYLIDKVKTINSWFANHELPVTPWDCYSQEDRQLIPVVVDMQTRGVKLDLEKAATVNEQLQQKANELLNSLPNNELIRKAESILYQEVVNKRLAKNKTGKLKKHPPQVSFNWDSNDHLKVLLYSCMGEVPQKKTKKGKDSVDNAVLEKLALKYSWIQNLIDYRKIQKLLSTYVENLFKQQYGGVIRGSFHAAGTATGRLSSSNPNMQNLPKWGGIKELYVPRKENKFIYADYSQLELRLAAHLSQDQKLLEAYQKNLDLHRITAAIVYNKKEAEVTDEERSRGKTINFSIIYNAGGYRLAEILGYFQNIDMNDKEAIFAQIKNGDKVRKLLFGRYKGLATYLKDQIDFLTKYRLAVSEFGRMRRLPGLSNPDDKKTYNHWLKAGFNMPIQSFGASICKRAMIELHKRGYAIINQIHDSIIIEHSEKDIDKGVKEVQNVMENIYELKNIKLKAEPKILTSFGEVSSDVK